MKTLHRGLATLALWAALSAPAYALTKFPFTAGYAIPAFATAFGRLNAAYQGTDGYLHIAQSLDGENWVADNAITSLGQADCACSLAYFQGKLFVAFETSDLHLKVASSSDGVTFSKPVDVNNNRTSFGAETLVASPTRLFLAFAGMDSATKINVIQSLDGVVWTNQYVASNTNSWAPWLAWGNGTLYLAYKGTNNAVSVMTSSDGIHWTAPTVYNGAYGMPDTSKTDGMGGTSYGPTASFIGGQLQLVWSESGVTRIQRAFGAAAPAYMGAVSWPVLYEFSGVTYLAFALNPTLNSAGAIYIARPEELTLLP